MQFNSSAQFNTSATFTWSGDVHPFHSLQASWAERAAGDLDHCTPFEPSYHILLLPHPSPTPYLRTPSVGLVPCRGAQTCSQETLRGSSTPVCQVAVCRCSCTRNKPCRLQSPWQDSTSRVHSHWCRRRHSSLARQACPFPGDVAGAACGKYAQSTQTSLHQRRRDTGRLPGRTSSPLPLCQTSPPLQPRNRVGKKLSKKDDKKISEPNNNKYPVCARRVDSSALDFSLSSHRHSYIGLVFSSCFMDY